MDRNLFFEKYVSGKRKKQKKKRKKVCLKSYKVISQFETNIAKFKDLKGEYEPVPLKTYSDAIIETEEGIGILNFTKKKMPLIALEIRAAAEFFTIGEIYGIYPEKIIFKTKKDNSPIVFNFFSGEYPNRKTNKIIHHFLEIYERIISELAGRRSINPISKEIKAVPNPFNNNPFSKNIWKDFCKEVCLKYQ